MKNRRRTYEVDLGGECRSVQIEELGSREDGLGRQYRVWIGDAAPVDVVGEELGNGILSLLSRGCSWEAGVTRIDSGFEVDILGVSHEVGVIDPMRKALRIAGSAGGAVVKSAMPGRVIRLLVEPGHLVEKGDPLLVLEAMKMENEIKAPREGTVKRIAVAAGDLIEARALLVELD